MTKVTPSLARDVHKRADQLGGWEKHGVKTQVCKEFNLSRPTLYELLRLHPTYSEKKYGEYVNFYEIPEIQQFQKIVGTTKTQYILKCWLVLDRKNPMNWDQQDLAILRTHQKLIDEKTGVIDYHILGVVRKFLRSYNPALYQKEEKNLLYTKGTKRQKGQKRKWFLTPDELTKFVSIIDDVEFGTQVVCQFKFGCRFSGFRNFKVKDIDTFPQREGNIIGMANIYETKTRKTWQKWMDEETYNVLTEYIKRRNLKEDEILFKHSLSWYNDRMKVYGTKAGLCRYRKVRPKAGHHKLVYESGIPMSSHLLRHTFAFTCSINDVSLEETADLGGWEDVNTLKDFYFYVPPEKLKKRYNSIDWNKKDFTRDKMSLVESRNEPITEEELKELEGEPE
jgi:integrase